MNLRETPQYQVPRKLAEISTCYYMRTDGRTDGQTDTVKLTGVFLQLRVANAPKNKFWLPHVSSITNTNEYFNGPNVYSSFFCRTVFSRGRSWIALRWRQWAHSKRPSNPERQQDATSQMTGSFNHTAHHTSEHRHKKHLIRFDKYT
jgi:hypothetical protein